MLDRESENTVTERNRRLDSRRHYDMSKTTKIRRDAVGIQPN